MKKILIVFVSMLFAQISIGQVYLESETTSDGFMGQGAFVSKSKTYVQGDAQRTETEFKFTGAIMKHFNPTGKEIDITRLDKELIWKFNDQQKVYQEITFAELKQMFEKGESEYEAPAGTETDAEEKDESDYEWEEPVIEVKKLGDSKELNGFNCDHYLATVMTVGTHKATGIKDTVNFVSDLWNTKNVGNAVKQVDEFQKKYLEALGFERMANQGLAMMSSMYLNQMQDLNKEISKIEGYTILNHMTLTSTKHATQSQEGEEVEAKEEESTEVSLDNIGGSLGGMFGKKLGKMAKQKVAPKKPAGNTVTMLQMTNETKAVKSEKISDDKFSVPSNYTLKK